MQITSMENFLKVIAGFRIVQVAVRSSKAICLALREDYSLWTDYKDGTGTYPSDSALEKRFITIFLDDPESWSGSAFFGFRSPVIAASQTPEEKLVAGGLDGEIFAAGSGSFGQEDRLPKDEDHLSGGLLRLKNISGHIYACGGNRSFARRDGVNNWTWFNHLFLKPNLDEDGELEDCGFADVDGFSDQDIYLVGDEGDVWHFDGQQARKLDFPSNWHLTSVCCGGDGKVYIGGITGKLFVGRDDSWREIKTTYQTLPFDQMTWFDERLWVTNDFGLWYLKDGKLTDEGLPLEARVAKGSISSADGLMLVGGFYGAAMLKDGVWSEIFSYQSMLRKAQDEGLLEGVLRARWHEFYDPEENDLDNGGDDNSTIR